MKKLVKTAKQQFEEDLNNLTLVRTWKMCDSEIYHHCVNGAGHFILFREQDEEYKILMYHKTYEELVLSEEFLFSVTQRFIDGRAEIKQLYNWYASADHEDEPFNLLDVFMSDLEAVNNTYEDEYEEVPDVRIITAKEQWEEDSTDAKVLTLDEEFTLKVKITDKNVVFYRSDDMYARIEYPSLEQMRADTCFVCEVTDSMNEANMQDDIAKFLRWIRVGGDFPIPLSVIFYSDYQNCKFEGYEDKELPQEQTIEKKDFSDRFSSLKSDIIANIGELYENGASIDIEILFESYSIAWIDGAVSYFEDVADFSLMKTLEGHWKYEIEFGHDKGKTYDGRLELLTLESLLHILDSLH